MKTKKPASEAKPALANGFDRVNVRRSKNFKTGQVLKQRPGAISSAIIHDGKEV